MKPFFIDEHANMMYYKVKAFLFFKQKHFVSVVHIMFDNDIYNVKEIVSVVLKYPQKLSQYPLEVDYSRKEPSHKNELFIYLGGRSIWSIGDTTFELREGDVVLIPSGISLEKYHVTVLEPVTFVNVFFVCDDINLHSPVLLKKPTEPLSNRFLKLATLWISKKEGYYTKSMSILYDIISHIQAAEKTYLPLKQYNLIKPSIEYLEHNFYKASFNYIQLASHSGLSYTYFKKLFIKRYGCSPVKQVTNLRINLARELIESDKFKITEIAEMCGFENVQYFSNTFKRIVGISPSKYSKTSSAD